MSTRYRVNGSNIVADVIEDEAVIVNLETGTYYSLLAPGAEIWVALRGGATVAQIQQLLFARYEGEPADIVTAVNGLLEEMEREGLLVPDNDPSEHAVPPAEQPVSPSRPPFQRPVLHRYSDMETILMLDPIHEVDETGWPAAKRPD